MKKMIPALILALAAAVLAACGGASGPSKSIRVTMTDFAFSPNSFTVPAGEQISVDLTNNGAVAHSFIILQAGHQVQQHFTDADKSSVLWEVTAILPGQSLKNSFAAPSEPGTY
ncbi:MAG: cupredoxin domain-containing protein, partial [Anaerolineae bacterium]